MQHSRLKPVQCIEDSSSLIKHAVDFRVLCSAKTKKQRQQQQQQKTTTKNNNKEQQQRTTNQKQIKQIKKKDGY